MRRTEAIKTPIELVGTRNQESRCLRGNAGFLEEQMEVPGPRRARLRIRPNNRNQHHGHCAVFDLPQETLV